MKPIANRRGHVLVDFIRLANDAAIDPVTHAPLTAALAVAEHQGKVLLVFDRYKQSREVPGGHIETGESPRDCAVRELMEESGQRTTDLDFVGVIKVRMKEGNVAFAAVYFCRLLT